MDADPFDPEISRLEPSLRPADAAAAERDLLEAVRAARLRGGRRCPHCGASRTIRWGRFSGRQRYRCRGCRRTFSDLTGSPLAYSKHLHLWLGFGLCMRRALPVRIAAHRLGINKDTALRWRHRLAAAFPDAPSPLPDAVAMIGTRLAHSQKGSRHLDRPPRARAEPFGRYSDPVHVLFLCPHESSEWDAFALPPDRFADPLDTLHGSRLADELAARLASGTEVILGPLALRTSSPRPDQASGDDEYRWLDQYGRPWAPLALSREPPPAGRPHRTPRTEAAALVQRARDVRHGWRDWSGRFFGVAYKYLPGYLRWFRQLTLPGGDRRPGDGTLAAEQSDQPSDWPMLSPAFAT